MLLYSILFVLSLILAAQRNKSLACRYNQHGVYIPSNVNIDWAVCGLLFMFACVSGFRYEMGGTDYEYYQFIYDTINGETNLLLTLAVTEYEVGYSAYVYICANILHLSYNGSLLLESFIFYSLLYLGLKRYMPNWGVFLLLFMYKMFFYVTMVAMRQAFTIAGFYCILRYLEERKMIKYYVCLLLLSLFHYGALILFVLYPLFKIKISRERLRKIGIVFGLSTIFSGLTGSLLNFVVSVLGLSQLEEKAAGYTGGASLNFLYTIEYFLLYVLLIQNYAKIKFKFNQTDFVIKLFLVVLPIVTLFRSTLILVRELPYFYPAYAIILYYIYSVSKSKKEIIIIFSMICLLGILKYVIQFDDGHFMDYKNWLFNNPQIHLFQS